MAASRQDDSHLIEDPSAFTLLTSIHKQAITDCCFSPDTDQILTSSEDSSVVLWNLPSRDIELHDETINDEHKLVCYRLYDHKEAVLSVSMHKRLFVSASRDGKVNLWRLSVDQPTTLPARSSYLSSHRNVRSLASSTSSSHFKIPNPDSCTPYNCHLVNVRSVALSPNARAFATGADDKSVKIWSTECINKLILSLLEGHSNWIKCVRWSKTNDCLLASCGDDAKICIWDTRTRNRQPPAIVIPARRNMQFNCLDWHPIFDHHIATGAQDKSCVVWDLRNKKKVQVYAEHNGSVNSVAFNSGGSLLLSGSSDKTSKIFDVCEGRNLFTLMSHSAPVTSVCFNATGELFATGSQDKTVTVWKRNFETINIIQDDDTIREEEIEDDEETSNYFNYDHHDSTPHRTARESSHYTLRPQ